MGRFVKITYIVIVILFILALGILGWYVMDERKEFETELDSLRKIVSECTLPKSEAKIDTPDDLVIVKEFRHTTPTDVSMKIIAFDSESKVVWSYVTEASPTAELSYDMIWPHYDSVYSLEDEKLVILNTFTGEVKSEVKFGDKDRFVTAGYYKDEIYALVDNWDDARLTQTIYKIDKDGHVISKKELPSPLYDGFDQTIEKVEMTRIDENEIEVFVTRYDKENIERIVDRNF